MQVAAIPVYLAGERAGAQRHFRLRNRMKQDAADRGSVCPLGSTG
jgi:hypothetical protein